MWKWLPALLGLLLVGACSRQAAPPPGGGEPRVQRILLRSHGSDGLGEGSDPVALAVGETRKVQVTAVWGIPSVEDVSPSATLTIEPAAAGVLMPNGAFRAQSPGPARLRAEVRVARGPARDELLAIGALAPAGVPVITFTDTLALTVRRPPAEERGAAGVDKSVGLEVVETVMPAPPGLDPATAPKASDELRKLKDAQLYPLAYLIEQRQFIRGQIVLAAGTRPANDQPPKDSQVWGRRSEAADWLLQQDDAALWVRGVAAPAPGLPVVVAGILSEDDSGGGFRGALLLRNGGELRTARHTLQRGEHLFFALPGARSVNCPVELKGDSLNIVYLDEKSGVVFEGVKPGRTTVRVFEEFRLSDERTLLAQFEVDVPE